MRQQCITFEIEINEVGASTQIEAGRQLIARASAYFPARKWFVVGSCGIRTLNKKLKAAVYPSASETRYGGVARDVLSLFVRNTFNFARAIGKITAISVLRINSYVGYVFNWHTSKRVPFFKVSRLF